MTELIRRWLGITEAEEDTCEAVARLGVRVAHLEADNRRLQAVVNALAVQGFTHIDELSRKRFMRAWESEWGEHDGGGVA